MERLHETLYPEWGQWFTIDEVLFEARTEHQHLVIFRNARYGRVMALDGVVQTTERDEFVYHEMMAHVPLLAHGRAKRVLIVGGGDGGMLREVTRHRSVEHVTQVEIDAAVIEMSRRHLPAHSAGAYDDPRVRIVIDDGVDFVNRTGERYDVIISDSTDPIGPGESLFTDTFYGGCRRILAPGGVIATQNGVPFMQPEEAVSTRRLLAPLFADAGFYCAAVPTYVGGVMAFAWATDDRALRATAVAELRRRYQASGIATRYYTPEVHAAAFALPAWLAQALETPPS
jgi:spermidine synthase